MVVNKMRANKACTWRVGFCAIFGLYLRTSRIMLSKFCPRPPTRK